jgi:glycosyltransferase involved in cell wall biosynthesis
MAITNKPKIAYLVKTYPRLSETFILNEILGLERLGLDLHIFSLRHPGAEAVHPKVAQVKAPVTYVPGLGLRSHPGDALRVMWHHTRFGLAGPAHYRDTVRFARSQGSQHPLKDFLQAGYLAGVLQTQGFSHLHAHFANLPTSVAETASRLSGVPYSFTAHAKDIYLSPPGDLRRKMRSARFVLTCTGYNERFLREIDPGAPVTVAYHGIDVGLFGAAPLAKPAAKPQILSVGRFCEKKGFPDLIDACKMLRDRGREFECRIIGFGPLEAELRKRIDSLGLSSTVRIEGQMTQADLAREYQQARMFVLPCRITEGGDRDGIPNVLLEAMASRIAVVSTPVSGITELIRPGHNGILAGERDVMALAEAMDLLLEDEALAARLGAKGRETVLSHFEMHASSKHIFDIFAAHVGRPRAKQRAGGEELLDARA